MQRAGIQNAAAASEDVAIRDGQPVDQCLSARRHRKHAEVACRSAAVNSNRTGPESADDIDACGSAQAKRGASQVDVAQSGGKIDVAVTIAVGQGDGVAQCATCSGAISGACARIAAGLHLNIVSLHRSGVHRSGAGAVGGVHGKAALVEGQTSP